MKERTIYVVDFGLAKEYIADDQHIIYRSNRNITGTVRYISINANQGMGAFGVQPNALPNPSVCTRVLERNITFLFSFLSFLFFYLWILYH